MLTQIFSSAPKFMADSSDITIENKITGLNIVGAEVYIKDLTTWKIVDDDLTLVDKIINSDAVISGTQTVQFASTPTVDIGTMPNIIISATPNVNITALPVILSTNATPEYVPAFYVSTTITRSTTVTAYTAGQIVLGNAATTLPYVDVTTAIGTSMANRRIAITSAFVISDNGANTAWSGFIDLFDANNPATAVNLADYASFTPTAAALVANFKNKIDSVSNSFKYGTTSNISWQSDFLRKALLDSNGKLYLAPVCSGAYTPKSEESFSILLKFYLLN